MVCETCGQNFQEDYRIDKYQRKKPLRFCSNKCAHSRKWSLEDKEKRSIAAKTSSKVKASLERNRGPKVKRIQKICPGCGVTFEHLPGNVRKFCSQKCYNKISGGLKEGSVKNYVHGVYEGYHYDSSWELKWIQWALTAGLKFKRNKIGFEYEFLGKKHKYYPDFYLIDLDEYVEIKGIQDELWEAKRQAFPLKLKVLGKKEIEDLVV